MPLTRRDLLSFCVTTVTAALTTPRLWAATTGTAVYENSIIIDGLGFPGGLSTE